MYGLDLFVYELPNNVLDTQANNPNNEGFFAEGNHNGLLNLTYAKGTPIFNSFTHFYNADQYL